MSGYFDLINGLIPVYDANCILQNSGSIITNFLVFYNFWPLFLSWVVIGITLVHYEYIYFLFTVVLLADFGINYGLIMLFGPSTNIQPPTCPVDNYQMPALASERVIVLYVVGWFLVTYIYPRPLQVYKIWLFNVPAAIAIYDRLYLLFSTPEQMLVGAGIGFLEGLLFSLLFLWMKHVGLDKVLIAAPSFLYLPPLADTLAYPETPTYVSEVTPTSLNVKTQIYSSIEEN